MPEKTPFTSPFTPEKPPASLSARDKLFADMGLQPIGPQHDSTMFADEPIVTESDDFISTTEAVAEPEEELVDAIFTSEAIPEPKETLIEAIFTSTEEPAPAKELSFTSTKAAKEEPVFTVTEPVNLTSHEQPELSEANSASALKSLDRAGLENIVEAYTDLQGKLAANQTLITAEREAIAELRNHMRQLNALGHDVGENSTGLDQGRQLIQADSCANLIRSINQVNDTIQQDSQRAAQLLSPIKAGVEVLELRVKHVSAIESLVAHMQEGMLLQKQLAGAERLMHDLAKQLGLNLL